MDQFWIAFADVDLKTSSQNYTMPYARRTLLGLLKVTFFEPRRRDKAANVLRRTADLPQSGRMLC